MDLNGGWDGITNLIFTLLIRFPMRANTEHTSLLLSCFPRPCNRLFKSHKYLMQMSRHLLFIMLEDRSIVEMQSKFRAIDRWSASFFQHLSKFWSEIDWSCRTRQTSLHWINAQMALLAQSRRHKTLHSSEKKIIQYSLTPVTPKDSFYVEKLSDNIHWRFKFFI